MRIESILSFKISELEKSSPLCIFCAVIKDGIEIMRGGVLKAELEGELSERDAFIIVQGNDPVEVKILGEGGNEDKAVRLQLFMKDGKC